MARDTKPHEWKNEEGEWNFPAFTALLANLALFFKARGLETQAAQGEAIGYNQSNLGKLKRRLIPPRFETLQEIADRTGIPVWELLMPPEQRASASRSYVERSLFARIQNDLSEDELISLKEAVEAAISHKRNGVSTKDVAEPQRFYFNLDRRSHSVEVNDDRRGKYQWTVNDPSGTPTEAAPPAPSLKAVRKAPRSSK